jgi:hypothetical protein
VPTSDDLWGSRLTDVRFDPVSHACTLDAVADDPAGPVTYRITCLSVTELSFSSTIPEPWTYAEVMEAYITHDEAAGQQLLEIMLWSEQAGIDIRCASVEVTIV